MLLLGPLLVFVFTLSQSVRDVYFGSVFLGQIMAGSPQAPRRSLVPTTANTCVPICTPAGLVAVTGCETRRVEPL